MRILNVISTVAPDSGGPSESLRQVGKLLKDQGHTVEVASADPSSADYLRGFPFPVHALGPGTKLFRYSAKLRDWLIANAGNYDALIGRGLWEHHGLALRAAALRARKPYWVFSHGMLDPWFNRQFPLKAIKKRLFWPWQHAVLRDAEGVLFTCEEERILARESFRPYQVREKVVSYGTARPPDRPDEQRSAFADAFPRTQGKRLLLFLGRLHPKKGCDLLLQAFADRYQGGDAPLLVMAGPDKDGYRDHLQQLARQLKIDDRIVWTGMLQDARKWGAFRSAEAFILPSHQENFGIAVVEALACGVPVLISKAVNISREVEVDGAGFVEADSLEGARELLRRWEETDGSSRSLMSERALACFESRFTVERAAESLLEALADREVMA